MLRKGDQVRLRTKPEWGAGQVLEEPIDGRIIVRFARAGVKVLSVSHAPLEPLVAPAAARTAKFASAHTPPSASPREAVRRESWTEEQLRVIEAGPEARLVVEAGPGTGKTAIACARVAHLIDKHRVPAAKVWLVSFTRTAVKEIRDRISQYVENRADALSVKITTLDSQVWYLRQGFDEQEVQRLLESYDANIERIINLLEAGHDGLLDYIEEIQHLIIDEAQDLVGSRNRLVCSLIRALQPSCGVTVFGDSAQAIYGFTGEEGENSGASAMSVMEELRSADYGAFTKASLSAVHRTSDAKLLDIFTRVRELVFSTEFTPTEKLRAIGAEIKRSAHGVIPSAAEQELAGKGGVLLLYRTRAEVLQASSFLWGKGVAHKLRMSGLPVRLQPWIARLFFDWPERSMGRDAFLERWAERVGDVPPAGQESAERIWGDLINWCGDKGGSIDLRQMRRVLSRSRPPIEFVVPDEMLPGPTVGTIHASKGREADDVHLMMPDRYEADEMQPAQIDEEGRVVFVGATRARRRLGVGSSRRVFASTVKGSGRVFSVGRKSRYTAARVEFGRERDIDIYKQVERLEVRAEAVVKMNQDFLWRNAYSQVDVYAESRPDTEWLYWLHCADEQHRYIGCLTRAVNDDLWFIAKRIGERVDSDRLRPGSKISYLHMTGARTVVLPEDDDLTGRLHLPYAQNGIFLVPVICAFTNVYFNFYRRRSS